MKTPGSGDAFSLALVVALVATALWYGMRPAAPAVAFAGPTIQDLDTLARYLVPVPPAPAVDEYDMFLPAASAPVRRTSSSLPPEPPQPRRLSAILLIGSEPIAIIDDQQVRRGATLPGGAQVVSIDRTGVLLREPDGSQRTLRISASATGN